MEILEENVVEKVAFWNTKAALGLSLKSVKLQRKCYYMEGLQKLTNAFSNGTIGPPESCLFPKIGGSQPTPKKLSSLLSQVEVVKIRAFGRYIHRLRIHPNSKQATNFWRK